MQELWEYLGTEEARIAYAEYIATVATVQGVEL